MIACKKEIFVTDFCDMETLIMHPESSMKRPVTKVSKRKSNSFFPV